MQKATKFFRIALRKSTWTFINILPIILGMLLLTSLVFELFPEQLYSGLFGNGAFLDSLLAAAVGSIAIGHPLASYLLGGEMQEGGVGLTAVTALLVTWVTVGIVQIPAEALMLGMRFAVCRQIISFFAAIAIAFLTVFTLRLLGAL